MGVVGDCEGVPRGRDPRAHECVQSVQLQGRQLAVEADQCAEQGECAVVLGLVHVAACKQEVCLGVSRMQHYT